MNPVVLFVILFKNKFRLLLVDSQTHDKNTSANNDSLSFPVRLVIKDSFGTQFILGRPPGVVADTTC
jgi:hypothetical protein